jgi:hypothetical protein
LEELLDDLTVCADEHYLEDQEIRVIEMQIGKVRALLNAYIRYLQERKENTVKESPGEYTLNSEVTL